MRLEEDSGRRTSPTPPHSQAWL
eukprot:COSAG04_NODE_17306_length_473_cov_0.521390_1_plen_22_part_10